MADPGGRLYGPVRASRVPGEPRFRSERIAGDRPGRRALEQPGLQLTVFDGGRAHEGDAGHIAGVQRRPRLVLAAPRFGPGGAPRAGVGPRYSSRCRVSGLMLASRWRPALEARRADSLARPPTAVAQIASRGIQPGPGSIQRAATAAPAMKRRNASRRISRRYSRVVVRPSTASAALISATTCQCALLRRSTCRYEAG